MRDAHNVLSSIALLSSCRLMPMVSFESIHFILVFLYFLLPSIKSSTDFFSQRTLFSNDEPQIGQFQFCHFFASMDVSGLICPRPHLFIFPSAQGICRALLQHRISNQPICFSISLLHYSTFAAVHSKWEYEDVGDLSLGL